MALGSEHPFAREDILPSWWANRIQEFLGAALHLPPVKVKVAIASTTTPFSMTGSVVVPAGPGKDAAVLSFDGKLRFNEAQVVAPAPPAGGSRPLDLFAAAYDNDISITGEDETDRSWGLVWAEHGDTPPPGTGGYDLFRRLCSGLFVVQGAMEIVDVLFAEAPGIELVMEMKMDGVLRLLGPMLIDFSRISSLPAVPDGTKITATRDYAGIPSSRHSLIELVATTHTLGKCWRPTSSSWCIVENIGAVSVPANAAAIATVVSFGELPAGIWTIGVSAYNVAPSGSSGGASLLFGVNNNGSVPAPAYISRYFIPDGGPEFPLGLNACDFPLVNGTTTITAQTTPVSRGSTLARPNGWLRPVLIERP